MDGNQLGLLANLEVAALPRCLMRALYCSWESLKVLCKALVTSNVNLSPTNKYISTDIDIIGDWYIALATIDFILGEELAIFFKLANFESIPEYGTTTVTFNMDSSLFAHAKSKL